jgi:hypothetical protein
MHPDKPIDEPVERIFQQTFGEYLSEAKNQRLGGRK